jgi:hypothetical protein
MMASVSHTARPSASTSTGTCPAGLTASTWRPKSEPGVKSKRSLRSTKGRPSCVISTQGRMDQEE